MIRASCFWTWTKSEKEGRVVFSPFSHAFALSVYVRDIFDSTGREKAGISLSVCVSRCNLRKLSQSNWFAALTGDAQI
jgi:hypothetical protein